MFEHFLFCFDLRLVRSLCLCVCSPAGTAGWWGATRKPERMTFSHLSSGHRVQKALTLQAPSNKLQSKPAGSPLSVFMALPLWLISIQCGSDNQLDSQATATLRFPPNRQEDNKKKRKLNGISVSIHTEDGLCGKSVLVKWPDNDFVQRDLA